MGASKKAVAKSASRASVKPLTLRQAEAQLQCVIDLAADFYWEQDAESRFTFYRPRGAPDEDLRDILGKTCADLCTTAPENALAADKQRVAVVAR